MWRIDKAKAPPIAETTDEAINHIAEAMQPRQSALYASRYVDST
jgi:hypothetical protein